MIHPKLTMLVFGLLLVALLPARAVLQTSPPGDPDASWIRIRSDDGMFSIEAPSSYKFYTDPEGFVVSRRGTFHQLRDMQMLNAFVDRTLLSFEIYSASKSAVDSIYDSDSSIKGDVEKTRFKIGETTVRQITRQTKEFFIVRQYFSARNKIYVLTALSRDSETEAAKRFLKSLTINSWNAGPRPGINVVVSQLKVTDIVFDQDLTITSSPLPGSVRTVNPPITPDDEIPLQVVSKPVAGYTSSARSKRVQGSIRLRATLSADGFVPKITVVGQALPEGLLRQALMAAIRLKFLPKEVDGVPVSFRATVEYTFSIY